MTHTYKIIVEYDGTPFAGWQRQAPGPKASIQGLLEEALGRFFNEPVIVHGSGRTDAGVHAKGQAASFQSDNERAPLALIKAVNSMLPAEIAVLEAQKMPGDFHARFSAVGKIYEYDFHTAATRSALTAKRAYHVGPGLNWEAMGEAARLLLGRRDFAAFQSTGSEVKNSVRTIEKACFSEPAENIKRLTLLGDGFLRHMVRSLAGALLQVGQGKISPRQFEEIIQKKDRALAGPTLPAHGLYLARVIY